MIGQYGDDRKKRKVISIPEYDVSIYKWCNLCENAKEHKDFYLSIWGRTILYTTKHGGDSILKVFKSKKKASAEFNQKN